MKIPFGLPLSLTLPLGLIPSLLLCAPSFAGIRMTSKAVGGGLEGIQEIRIENGKLRMDFDQPATMSMVYVPKSPSGADARVTQIDHAKKAYVRMTESELKKMGNNLKAARSQADALLAALPPELRNQANSLLGGAAPKKETAPAEPLRFRSTGRRETVARVECEIFSGTAPSKAGKTTRSEEVCFAKLEALGIPDLKASEFQAFSELTRLYSSFSNSFGLPEIPKLDPQRSRETFGTEGFPVRIRQLEGAKVVSETVLQEIRRETIEASSFLAPTGYKKRTLTEMMTR
jgi:hypothetical protein